MDRNAFALESGDVVGVPRFEVADVTGKWVVVSAGPLLAARALNGPGFIRRRCTARTWSVGIPAGERVRGGVGKVWSGEPKTPSGLLLLDDKKARCSIREFSCGQAVHVLGIVGADFPEALRVIAVFRAGNGVATRARMQSGFKCEGSPCSDFACVLFFDEFEVTSNGVVVDALFEGFFFHDRVHCGHRGRWSGRQG